MKVAVVIPAYGLVGGAEGFARELCERLALHAEFEIHVFANRWQSGNFPIHFHKVPIIPFPRFCRPISFAYFVQRHLEKGHYDLIHSHERIFQMDLYTLHGFPHKTWIKRARRKRLSLFDRATAWVEKKGLKSPNYPTVMAVSDLVKEEFLKAYDIPEAKIHVIHGGFSDERFSGLKRSVCRLEVRRRHGLSEEDIVVLFVGMNFEIKRLNLVIEGVAKLVQEGKAFSKLKIVVVGKGNIGRYHAMANRLGMGERITFVGITGEVEKYYLASDIFALPSEFDAFPLAALEAMAAGLPVIISGHVGTRDIIENGVNGFVLEDHPSSVSFSKGLAIFLDKEKRMEMGENARKVAEQHTWAKTTGQVAQLYHRIWRVKKNL